MNWNKITKTYKRMRDAKLATMLANMKLDNSVVVYVLSMTEGYAGYCSQVPANRNDAPGKISWVVR